MELINAAETWGADEARLRGAARGADAREYGANIEDVSAPLSGEWAGDPTPGILALEILGDDYDLYEADEPDYDHVVEVLADAYEDAFNAVLAGYATVCGPLTRMNGICETPGTYCTHTMTR